MTLTEWYPITIQPVREGTYLFRSSLRFGYVYFCCEYTHQSGFWPYSGKPYAGKSEWCGLTEGKEKE